MRQLVILLVAGAAGCTLDLVDVTRDDAHELSAPADLQLSVLVEAGVPEGGSATARITASFRSAIDGDGVLQPAEATTLTFGDGSAGPREVGELGWIQWELTDTTELQGDTLRLPVPRVEGLEPVPDLVIPLGLSLTPRDTLVLERGADLVLDVALPQLALDAFTSHASDWHVWLPPLRVMSRGDPPSRIRIDGEMLVGVELPAALEFRAVRRMSTVDPQGYRISVQVLTVAQLDVVRGEDTP